MAPAALTPRKDRRSLLLEHCLGTAVQTRPARERLDAALGEDLSRRLVLALSRPRP